MTKNAPIARSPLTSSLDQTIEHLAKANSQASEAIHAVAKGIEVAAGHSEKIGYLGISLSQNNFTRAIGHIQAVSSAASLTDMIERQSELFNDNLGSYLQDMSNLNEVVLKAMSAIYGPVWIGIWSDKTEVDDHERRGELPNNIGVD